MTTENSRNKTHSRMVIYSKFLPIDKNHLKFMAKVKTLVNIRCPEAEEKWPTRKFDSTQVSLRKRMLLMRVR